MEILVHQAEFDNEPVHIGVAHIKNVSPIDGGVHKAAIMTTTKRFFVIESKEEIKELIKEAVKNG